MYIKLKTSCWGHDMVFKLDTGAAWSDSLPEADEFRINFNVINGFRDDLSLEVTVEQFKPLLDLISKSRIHPFVSGPLGVDGVTYELTVSEGMSTATFNWWTQAEKGWGALDKIAAAIISLAEKAAGKEFHLAGGD